MSARLSQRLARPHSAGSMLASIPVRPASALAALAHAKRAQLEALVAAGVTASLCQDAEGRTRLASLLPARERLSGVAARHGVRRVFTLQRSRALAVLIERR